MNRTSDHWTKRMLTHLQDLNLGWAKNIQAKLIKYELELNWDNIGRKPKAEWKKTVSEAVDKKNQQKMIDNCTTKTKDGNKINTKSRSIHEKLTSPEYKRLPLKEMTQGTRQRTKTLILARHGMLECGANLKGTMSEKCQKCNVINNETDVYSDNDKILDRVILKGLH